jgi:hypothetical protein
LPHSQPQGTAAGQLGKYRGPDSVVFDPKREAILLVAGDKAGRWRDWYRESVPLAEARYDEYLAAAADEVGKDGMAR